MQTLSQRNGLHVSFAQADGALQNPAYRPADVLQRGVRRQHAGPLTIFVPVIPGLAKREPGIHLTAEPVEKSRPGITVKGYATIFSSTAINASGAVTFGAWLASISK